MSDLKSKLPDLSELTNMTSKLFKDIKQSVTEIVDDYKKKRAEEASEVKDEARPTPATTTPPVAKPAPEIIVPPASSPAAHPSPTISDANTHNATIEPSSAEAPDVAATLKKKKKPSASKDI